MWRKLLTLSGLLFLLNLVISATWIYDPVAGTVTDQGSFYIGKGGKNHIVKLIMNAEYPDPIHGLTTDYPSVVTKTDGRIYIEFNAPSESGPHNVEVTVERNSGIESFTVGFDVVERPLEVKTDKNVVFIPELGTSTVNVVIVNPLASSTYVMITSPDAPKSLELFVPRHEVIGPKDITLSAGFSGTYDSKIVVRDLLSGEEYTIPIKLQVTPTMEGRIESVRIGPDFFTPILYPARLLMEVFLWLRM